MRNVVIRLFTIGCYFAVASALWAADAPVTQPAGAADDSSFTSRYGSLIRVCGLSAEQQDKVKAIDQAMEKSLDEARTANADKLREIDAAIAAAKAAKDSEALARAMQDKRDLLKPMWDTSVKAHDDIMALLTDDQKAAWKQHCVIESVKATFARANLTSKQIDQVKALYAEAAKVAGATSATIGASLKKQVWQILTPDQAVAMKLAPTRSILPPKAPTGGTGSLSPATRPAN
jgi:Spy/CpxP family protein refolding chaperone